MIYLCHQYIYSDVTAYVDVRTQDENRSDGIRSQLASLGATVVATFTNQVTHVIYKDGYKATLQKANKTGVHLVSVLWVHA